MILKGIRKVGVLYCSIQRKISDEDSRIDRKYEKNSRIASTNNMQNNQSKMPNILVAASKLVMQFLLVKLITWLLAQAEGLLSSRDDRARVAKVKTKIVTLVRPIQKLHPLEVPQSFNTVIQRRPRSCRLIEVLDKQTVGTNDMNINAYYKYFYCNVQLMCCLVYAHKSNVGECYMYGAASFYEQIAQDHLKEHCFDIFQQ